MFGTKMDDSEVRQKLCGMVNVPENGAVLDAGCGDGADLRRIGQDLGPEARLVGAEAMPSALEKRGRRRRGMVGSRF